VSAPEWLRPLLDSVDEFSIWGRAVGEAPVGVRRSAVLVLFGEGSHGPDLLLIQRSAHLRSHAGQPAFPGGGLDHPGETAVDAALREAEEETGLDPAGVEVLAELSELWVPPSGNVVTPVVAWWREPSEVTPADVREVASVARVPIAELADPDNRLQVQAPSGHVGVAFEVADMLVWGFTAAVLDRLLDLGGWAKPWDTSRVIDLPEEALRLAMRQRRFEPNAESAGEGAP
jgi:8-oxo-dGTP pyrophosphatase MutT (NUDIX family)